MTKSSAKGTVLQLSIAASFTTIAQVQSISGPDAEVETIETRDLSSGTGVPHMVTGYVEGGSVSFSGFFDPVAATHQALTDLISTPSSSESWKIIYSDSGTTAWPFTGILKSFTPKAEAGSALMFDGSVKLNGIVTYPT